MNMTIFEHGLRELLAWKGLNDASVVAARRKKLVELFQEVPRGPESSVYIARLSNPSDPMGRLFQTRLHTAVRDQLLGILMEGAGKLPGLDRSQTVQAQGRAQTRAQAPRPPLPREARGLRLRPPRGLPNELHNHLMEHLPELPKGVEILNDFVGDIDLKSPHVTAGKWMARTGRMALEEARSGPKYAFMNGVTIGIYLGAGAALTNTRWYFVQRSGLGRQLHRNRARLPMRTPQDYFSSGAIAGMHCGFRQFPSLSEKARRELEDYLFWRVLGPADRGKAATLWELAMDKDIQDSEAWNKYIEYMAFSLVRQFPKLGSDFIMQIRRQIQEEQREKKRRDQIKDPVFPSFPF